jgi:hypothetical protein
MRTATVSLFDRHNHFERGRFGCGLAIFGQTFKMKSQSFGCHLSGFVQVTSSGDYARKVGKRNAVVAVSFLMD